MSSQADNQLTGEKPEYRRCRAIIFLCALASLGLYVVLPKVAMGMGVAEPSHANEVFRWVKDLTKPALVALQDSGAYSWAPVRFLGVCAGLFAIYGFMLRVVRGQQSVALQTLIFGAGAVFLMIQLIAPIMLSTDVYAYAIYGRVLSVHGANPYSVSPPVSDSDPFMPLFGLPYLPSWYGPLWTLISAGTTWVGGERVGLTVLLFRGMAVLAGLATAGLLWNNLRRIAPERAAQGLVLFLWNPLLIIETGLSGHNDAVMLGLVLLGVWLHLRGCKTGAVVALTLSALVKFLTGMLIPLYIWMVLRQAATWRERAGFLARSVVAGGIAAAAALAFAQAGPNVPASRAATAPDFYGNNFHELIFKGLRRALGEEAQSVSAPIYFQGWWIAARTNTSLSATASPEGEVRQPLATGAKLLVIAPQLDKWAWVHEPLTQKRGYVDTSLFKQTVRPTVADAATKQLESPLMKWPTVRTANFWLRLVTWSLFAGFGLLAAWRTTNLNQFLVWSGAALIASYFLIITEIWPWYINWALALGAMAPTRWPARFAVLLSAGVMTLYVTIGFFRSDAEWIYTWRSLPAFVLPLLVFLVLYFRRAIWTRHADAP